MMSTNQTKFCTECGSKIPESAVKCPECGKLLNVGKAVEMELTSSYKKVTTELKKHAENKDEYIEKSKAYVEKGKSYLPKIKSKMKEHKNLSIAAGCLLGIFIICLMGINIINRGNTPDKLIDKFETAVINDDYKTLMKIVACEDKRVTMDELAVMPLLSYFDKVPSAFTYVISELRSQAVQLEEGTYDSDSYGRFTLKQKDGKNSYYIEVKPIFIKLESELNNAQISIGESEERIELQAYTPKEIGPIFPGYYYIHSYYDDGFIKLEEHIEQDLFEVDEYNDMAYMQVFSDVREVALESDYNEAVIYINGKSTGLTLEEQDTICPVNADTKIYGVVTRDGKEFKSNEYVVGSEYYIDLEFPELEAYENKQEEIYQSSGVEEEVSLLMELYLSSFAEAVNVGEFSLVEPYLYPNSNLYNMQETNIPNMHDVGIRETFIDYTMMQISYNEDSQMGYVTVEEIYEVRKQKPSVSTEEMSFENTYTFKFNSDNQVFQLTELNR